MTKGSFMRKVSPFQRIGHDNAAKAAAEGRKQDRRKGKRVGKLQIVY